MTLDDAFGQAFVNHPVGVIIGISLYILCWFIGSSILVHGWPKFGPKK